MSLDQFVAQPLGLLIPRIGFAAEEQTAERFKVAAVAIGVQLVVEKIPKVATADFLPIAQTISEFFSSLSSIVSRNCRGSRIG